MTEADAAAAQQTPCNLPDTHLALIMERMAMIPAPLALVAASGAVAVDRIIAAGGYLRVPSSVSPSAGRRNPILLEWDSETTLQYQLNWSLMAAVNRLSEAAGSHWRIRREQDLGTALASRPDFASGQVVMELKPYTHELFTTVLQLAVTSKKPQDVVAPVHLYDNAMDVYGALVQTCKYMHRRGARFAMLWSGARGIVLERQTSMAATAVPQQQDLAIQETEVADPATDVPCGPRLDLAVWGTLFHRIDKTAARVGPERGYCRRRN